MNLHRQGWFADLDYYELFAELMDASAQLIELSALHCEALRRAIANGKERDRLEHELAAAENDIAALRASLRLLSEVAYTL